MEPKYSRDELKRLFRSKGVHITSQRVEMAYILLNREFHFTAEEANMLINEKLPKASRSTVFNILSLFTEMEFLKKLDLNPGVTVYDSNVKAHHHFVESKTGEVIDIMTEPEINRKIEREIKELIAKYDTSLIPESIQIVVRGRKMEQVA